MGGKQINDDTKIKVINFGVAEYLDFDLNIWMISDSNKKKLLKKLTSKKEIENFDEIILHEIYKGWKFYYKEKTNDKDLKSLFNTVIDNIKQIENSENRFNNKNAIIICMKEIEKKLIKYIFMELIKKEFKENIQPFLIFITEERDLDNKKEEIKNFLSDSAKEYIEEKYKNNNEEKKLYLDNFEIEKYYMPFNIFICKFKEAEFEEKKQNNNNDNNINLENEGDTELNELIDFEKMEIIREKEEIDAILKNLTNFAYYYNQLGESLMDEKNTFKNNYINIFCVGRTNTGKSTFINTYLNSRKCIVGDGTLATTNRICYYNDNERNIRLYDAVGFEGNQSNQKVLDYLKKFKNSFSEIKQKIHLILYFLGDPYFAENEIPVFFKLLEFNSHIIFVKTKMETDKENEYKDKKDLLKRSLKELIEKAKKEKNKKIIEKLQKIIKSKYENLILMNLRRKEIGQYFSKKFGMDKLFNAIYIYFNDNLIDPNVLSLIKSLKNSSHIYRLIENNLFLENFTSINDILKSINSEKNKIIAKNAFYATLSGINPIPLVDIGTFILVEKHLREELANLYKINISKEFFEKYFEILELDNNNNNKNINNNDTNNNEFIVINSINDINDNNSSTIGKNKNNTPIDNNDNKTNNLSLGMSLTSNISKSSVQFGKIAYDIIQTSKAFISFKNVMQSFLTICKSSIILGIVGSIVGGILGFANIIYIGNKYANYFEKILKQDGGKNYIIKTIESYQDSVNLIKDFAENLKKK